MRGSERRNEEGGRRSREGGTNGAGGHYGISLIAVESPARRLIRSRVGAIAARRRQRINRSRGSRLFDRFNYTRGPLLSDTRKPACAN